MRLEPVLDAGDGLVANDLCHQHLNDNMQNNILKMTALWNLVFIDIQTGHRRFYHEFFNTKNVSSQGIRLKYWHLRNYEIEDD